MKKNLLTAVILSAASLTFAAQKTVTFDLSKPANYGYTAAEEGKGTNLNVGDKVSSDGVDITVTANGNTPVRFFTANTTKVITFRLASGDEVAVSAGGEKIKSITLEGNNCTFSTNFTSNVTGWSGTVFTGSADTVKITRSGNTIQLSSMTVVYGEAEAGGEEDEMNETYEAITNGVLADCFNNATSDGAKSIVSFGTENMEATAVGARVPNRVAVDIKLHPDSAFAGWETYTEPSWSLKSQNLCDKKPGVDTLWFNYVLGTGNPVVEIGHSAAKASNSSADTIFYDPTYIYYGPQDTTIGEKTYTHDLPKMGLYYTFKPKKDGYLKIKVWSNKGSRNTYLIDEATAMPVKYKYEGYINAQDEQVTATMKSSTGADSIGTMNRKRFLTAVQIDSLHYTNKGNFKVDTTFVDATLTGEARVATANVARIDTTDLMPYVIGAGTQPFFGWVTVHMTKGQCFWLFQDSSQIGFAGYTFSAKEPVGIEKIERKEQTADRNIFDITGRRVNKMQSGKLYIMNGHKIIVR